MKNKFVYLVTIVLAVLYLVAGHYFAVQGLSFFKEKSPTDVVEARVVKLLPAADGAKFEQIRFEAELLSGRQQGVKVTAAQNKAGSFAVGRDVAVGDKVLLLPDRSSQGEWSYAEHLRSNVLMWLFAVFALSIIAFGRMQGVNTLISLIFCCLSIFAVFVPAILSGKNVYCWTILTCAFIVVTNLLPKSVKRLIYMDADIICKGELLPLWQTDLQGRVLGAVRDWGEEKSCVRIGLKNGRYFNSGVLLMDLVKWRQQKLTQKLFRWLEQVGDTKILWGDQDALNGVIDGDFVELPKKYNCIIINNTLLKADPEDVIVHYIDYIKPWHIYCLDSDEKKLYWRYVKKSLWDDLQPMDGHTVDTTVMTARVLYKEGSYEKAISYYEALLKYFLKDKYT